MELGTALTLACSVALFVVPRSWAPTVFLLGVLYCPMGTGLVLGTTNFPPGRLLAAVGLARVWLRGELPTLGRTDQAAIVFGAAMILSGLFHDDPREALWLRCGYAIDTVGSYFVLRSLISTLEDVYRCFSSLLLLFLPIALEMLWEASGGTNLFSHLGSLDSESVVRRGRIRAQGPFRHAILAGTAAAALVPIAIGFYRKNRSMGFIALCTALLAVLACASSGPLLTLSTALAAILLWHQRGRIKAVLWAVVVLLCTLHIVMSDPVWFFIAKLNLVGGSTGWHRAKLIDSAITHIGEWWFAGTDYTRHWMSGHGFNESNIDITNYYIRCGVNGGLPLLIAFLWLLKRSFSEITVAVDASISHAPVPSVLFLVHGRLVVRVHNFNDRS